MTEPDSETTGEEKSQWPRLELPIGIDISAWPQCVAVREGTEVKLFSNAANTKIMKAPETFRHPGPSCGAITAREVSLSKDQEHDMFFKTSVCNMRRMIGRIDSDPVVQASKNLPFLVHTLDIGVGAFFSALVENVENVENVEYEWRYSSAEQFLSVYLDQLRGMVENLMQRSVRNVVLTVPVSFSRFQLARIHYMCGMAGLHVLKLIPQPTAVALWYAQQQWRSSPEAGYSGREGTVYNRSQKIALIFNMDSGYCDVAVTAATSEGKFQMKALAGSAIGGEDFIRNMMCHLLPDSENIFKKHSDGNEKLRAIILLREATLEAIHQLNHQTIVKFDLDLGHGLKICKVVRREEFEEVNKEVYETCERLIRQCVRDAKVKFERLNDVIIVGECENIPKVKNLVTRICIGSSKKKKRRNATELYNGMDPLEAALCGTAVAVASDPLNLHLFTSHITSLSLGIRANRNNFVCVIPRNTSIPTNRVMDFTTIHENQTEALILVYEGEKKKAEENQLLGYLKITGIPEAPKGVPKINVCMCIDDENCLRIIVSVFRPGSLEPVIPAMEARMPMPMIDDGHFLPYEALKRTYGNTMDLATLNRE